MNIRKNIDYTQLYAAIDSAMEAAEKKQMELYCEIGKAVCQRSEKGAAVAAAAYLSEHYPDAQGFSPRNLRRMRDFYRAYEDQPALLSLALQIGWTQNVVIMEADLSMEQLKWYLKAEIQFGWSKAELTEKLTYNAHEVIVLAPDDEACYIEKRKQAADQKKSGSFLCRENRIRYLITMVRYRIRSKRDNGRRWNFAPYHMFTMKQTVFMRC